MSPTRARVEDLSPSLRRQATHRTATSVPKRSVTDLIRAYRLRPSVAGIAIVLPLALGTMVALDQPHASYYLVIAERSLVFSVPWLFVASNVAHHGRVLHHLQAIAVLLLIAGTARLVLPEQLAGGSATYSQSDGYLVLPAAIIFVDAFVRRPRARTVILAVAAITVLLASGARGPLFALLIFGLARGVLALRRRPGALLILIAVGVAVAETFDVALRAAYGPLSRTFTSVGLSTRSLDRLVGGDFLQDRARTSIARLSWDLTLQHPLGGVGVARDRLLLADAMGVSDPQTVRGWYPHNIVLELVLQYGFFLGGALILFLAVIMWRSVLDTADVDRAQLILVFVGIGLFPLFVSGSYLTWPPFFALLGFCLSPRSVSSRMVSTHRTVAAARSPVTQVP